MDKKLDLILNSKEYYFQKLENVFKDFDKYIINDDQIDLLIDKVISF